MRPNTVPTRNTQSFKKAFGKLVMALLFSFTAESTQANSQMCPAVISPILFKIVESMKPD